MAGAVAHPAIVTATAPAIAKCRICLNLPDPLSTLLIICSPVSAVSVTTRDERQA
jgi:hypothetical protein